MSKNPRTWVLLRGLVREKGHWGPFLEGFQAAFPDDHVLAIDLPGAGEYRDMNCPRNMQQVFQFVRGQVVEKAPAQSRYSVLAISMGGMVALEWMRLRPEDLESCILINTSLKSLSPIYQRLRWQIWQRFLKIISMQVPRDRERAIIDLLMNSEEARQKALPLWVKLATERPVSYANFMNQLFAAARFHGLDEKPAVPVLLLSSLGDRFTDPSCSEALHEAWSWPIERHPWAGHDLPWDDPDWVLKKVESWAGLQDAKRQ
jgi:pimeloyl-ACP methyl ester carboxylesterase